MAKEAGAPDDLYKTRRQARRVIFALKSMIADTLGASSFHTAAPMESHSNGHIIPKRIRHKSSVNPSPPWYGIDIGLQLDL